MARRPQGPRHRFQLDVLFKGGPRMKPALTHTVGLHGVFIRTDEHRPMNQLVRFSVVDPQGGRHLDLMGIVTQVVPMAAATRDQPPGIDVELFGNAREAEAWWLHLMRRVKAWVERGYTSARCPGYDPWTGTVHDPEDAPQKALPPRPAEPAPPPAEPAPPAAAIHRRAAPKPQGAWITQGDTVRRQHVRRPAGRFNVTVRPADRAALSHFGLKDISEGGTFVLAGQLLPVGTRVNVRLVHPDAPADFLLTGEVVRVVDSKDPDEKGMGIQFDTGTVDVHEWVAFLQQAAPVRQPEVAPVPDDAPQVKVLRRRRPGDGQP
ncbi:MAG: PilZ domain-containing protein [Myxococcales bacterium]|nr:PilZ domain-containing protein [Myxococcales bacterium]